MLLEIVPRQPADKMHYRPNDIYIRCLHVCISMGSLALYAEQCTLLIKQTTQNKQRFDRINNIHLWPLFHPSP